jgi:hypothetical protein
MSFDLMVFNPDAAPKDHNEFLTWYEEATEWEDDGTYNNPASAHPKLYQWYKDMQEEFPDMNGEYSDEHIESVGSNATGYSFGPNIIYIDFRWSVADRGAEVALTLAQKHTIGFFDPQSETIYFPSGDSYLLPLQPQQETKKPWWKLW